MAVEGIGGESFIGRIDPRVRLIAALIYSVMVALERRPLPLVYASALPVCAVSAARLSPGALLRRLAPANLFILLLWLILPFSYPDRSVGLHHALLITVRSNLIPLLQVYPGDPGRVCQAEERDEGQGFQAGDQPPHLQIIRLSDRHAAAEEL